MTKKEITLKYFAGKFKDWNVDSYSPLIELQEVLGDIDNIELNCEILLDVHEVFNEPFSEKTEQEMKDFH
jgi:exoribonuclease R